MAGPNVVDRIADLSFLLDLDPALTEHVIQAFIDVGEPARLQQNASLLSEGDAGSDVGYIVLQGLVAVERSDGFRKTMPAPALLGEMKQFHFNTKEERTATVQAATDLQVLRFEWESFYEKLEACTTEEEREAFRVALRDYAWMHFLELEQEL
jgi:CRP-like cAMP-binding protein